MRGSTNGSEDFAGAEEGIREPGGVADDGV